MFTFYTTQYVVFEENISGNRVVVMRMTVIVARGDGCCGVQEHLKNRYIGGDITVKAARADVNKKRVAAN